MSNHRIVDVSLRAAANKLKEIALDGFTGDLSVTLGSVLQAVFGTRTEHCFTSRRELLAYGGWGGMGTFVGQVGGSPLGQGGAFSFASLGGASDFVIGKRTSLIYGSPIFEVRRGGSLLETTYGMSSFVPDPASFQAGPGMLNNPMSFEDGDSDEDRLAYPMDDVSRSQQVSAPRLATSLRVLQLLLTTSAAATELAVRFKYPQFDPSSESRGQAEASFLMTSANYLTSFLMALINLMEQAGSWTKAGQFFVAGLDNTAKKVAKVVFLPATGAKAAMEAFEKLSDEYKNLVKAVFVVLALLAIVGVAVGMIALL